MSEPKEIAVSELKAKLLQIVREVQSGRIFRITKGGKPVAILSPSEERQLPAVSFAKVVIRGDLSQDSSQNWTLDLENVKKTKK